MDNQTVFVLTMVCGGLPAASLPLVPLHIVPNSGVVICGGLP